MPNLRKEKRCNLKKITTLPKPIQFSFSTSAISFAVAVTIRMPLSLMLSSSVSSCRLCVDFSAVLSGKRIGLRICHNGLQAHKRFAGLAVALCFQYSQGSEGKCSFRRLLSCGFHFCLSALLLWLARKLQSHTKVLVFLL